MTFASVVVRKTLRGEETGPCYSRKTASLRATYRGALPVLAALAMKILFLDEEFPFPPNSGKRIRSFQLASYLARGNHVVYLAYGQPDDMNATGLQAAGIETVAVPREIPPKSGPLFYARLLANLAQRDPYIVTSHYSLAFQHLVHREVARHQPDVVICEWTPYAAFVRELTGIKKVVSAHNVEYRIWERYYENAAPGPKRWYIGQQMRKVKDFEARALSWVDAATAVSELDAVGLKALCPSTRVAVVSNGVDLEYFTPQSVRTSPSISPHKLVFVGSMDWRPNQDACVYCVEEILPRLRKHVPDVELALVGRNPPSFVQQLAQQPGVTVTGSVDDVRPYMAEAAVYVVPLRIGSGTRLKILDALAMAKGVVSTSVGAEGLNVEDGRHLLLADDAETFTAKVLELFANPSAAARLGQAGRQLVEEQYGWNALGQQLEEFLLQITGSLSAVH